MTIYIRYYKNTPRWMNDHGREIEGDICEMIVNLCAKTWMIICKVKAINDHEIETIIVHGNGSEFMFL